jgi:hypothetical protein
MENNDCPPAVAPRMLVGANGESPPPESYQ